VLAKTVLDLGKRFHINSGVPRECIAMHSAEGYRRPVELIRIGMEPTFPSGIGLALMFLVRNWGRKDLKFGD
jgi:hypothetical protein